MNTENASSSPPIQKLLIAHWDLAELSTGRSLSDSASEEALREEILYFYNGSSSLHQWSASSCIEKTKEAIVFNGLCKALYQFPNSLASNTPSVGDDDSTQEVYLGESILVFIRIEPQSIVSVVQASRTVTPSAVRASLARSHELFCLLRGGGIHRRLCSQQDLANELAYSQIEPIYRLWKEISNVKSRLLRVTDYEDGQKHLEELIAHIDDLYKTLPLIPLRRDLRIHYDAYVGELNQLADTPNILFRLTEEIPIPVPSVDGAHMRFSMPLPRQFENIRPMEDAIGKFLKNQDRDLAYILHVCCIHDGKIVFRNGSKNSAMSHQTVALTWNYMHRIRMQVQSLRRVSQTNSRSSTPTNRTLSNLMLSLGKKLEDAVQLSLVAPNREDQSYLAPPPLSLLSTLDEANGFKGPSEESMVWCLPVSVVCQRSDSSPEIVDAYASMYCLGDLSFLFFWKQGSAQSDRSTQSSLFFRDFETTVSAGLHRCSCDGLSSKQRPPEKLERLRQAGKWHTEGIDIVFIDRKRDNLILFSDPSRQLVAETERSGRSPRRLGTTPPKPRSEQPDLSVRGFDHFDCRHISAAHLPSEAILCLEDAIDRANQATSEDLPFETCSFLPQRWLYALKDKKRHDCFELYIIFDASKFVTLTDVQISAREIRRNIISKDEESYNLFPYNF